MAVSFSWWQPVSTGFWIEQAYLISPLKRAEEKRITASSKPALKGPAYKQTRPLKRSGMNLPLQPPEAEALSRMVARITANAAASNRHS